MYVDDFKLAGPSKENVHKGWKLIQQHVDMEDPTDLDLYLGCKHQQSSVTLPDGHVVRTVTYNMEDYLVSAIKKYKDLASELQKRPVNLIRDSTP